MFSTGKKLWVKIRLKQILKQSKNSGKIPSGFYSNVTFSVKPSVAENKNGVITTSFPFYGQAGRHFLASLIVKGGNI